MAVGLALLSGAMAFPQMTAKEPPVKAELGWWASQDCGGAAETVMVTVGGTVCAAVGAKYGAILGAKIGCIGGPAGAGIGLLVGAATGAL